MKSTKYLIAVAILSIFSSAGAFQERLPVSEQLRWFPEGTVIEFGSYDVTAAKKSPAYANFTMMFSMDGDQLFGENPPLPKSLLDAASLITFARPETLGTIEERDAAYAELKIKNKEKMSEKEKTAIKEKAQELHDRYQVKSKIWACEVPGLSLLVEQAVKAGTFAKTGVAYRKLPIYAVAGEGSRGQSKADVNAYACAVEEGTLLVAPSIAVLKSMVDAGRGIAARMADQQEYAESFPYLQDRGEIWTVRARRVESRLKLEKMTRDGAEDEQVQKFEKSLEQDSLFEMSSFTLSNEVLMQQMSLFETEEAAKAQFAKVNADLSQAGSSIKEGRKAAGKEMEKLSAQEKKMVNMALGFAGNLLESQRTEIQGNLVTTSIIMNEKQLKTLGSLVSFAKMMESKEKKEEAKRK